MKLYFLAERIWLVLAPGEKAIVPLILICSTKDSESDSAFYFQNLIFKGAKMLAHSSLKLSDSHDTLP